MQGERAGTRTRTRRSTVRTRPRWARYFSRRGMHAGLVSRSNVTKRTNRCANRAKRPWLSPPLISARLEGRGGAIRLRCTSICPNRPSSRSPSTRLASSRLNTAGEERGFMKLSRWILKTLSSNDLITCLFQGPNARDEGAFDTRWQVTLISAWSESPMWAGPEMWWSLRWTSEVNGKRCITTMAIGGIPTQN